jgi:hypothetical protein
LRWGVRREVELFIRVVCERGESNISARSGEEAVDANLLALNVSTAGSAVEEPDASE